jgi:hypothetical protein
MDIHFVCRPTQGIGEANPSLSARHHHGTRSASAAGFFVGEGAKQTFTPLSSE